MGEEGGREREIHIWGKGVIRRETDYDKLTR